MLKTFPFVFSDRNNSSSVEQEQLHVIDDIFVMSDGHSSSTSCEVYNDGRHTDCFCFGMHIKDAVSRFCF